MPIRVLFETWHNIPHSYGIVSAFILIHFKKYFSDKITLFVKEPEYFREHWNKCKGQPIYTEEYNKIISELQQWTPDQEIDIIYRQTYPYNITLPDPDIPKVPIVVFYTSEFATLDVEYFKLDNLNQKIVDDHIIRDYILNNHRLAFTSPSKWSEIGLQRFIDNKISNTRNRLITHGVDTSIYKKLHGETGLLLRNKIRELYNIKPDDIILLNIGAMTQNKGIIEILILLSVLVYRMNQKKIKLMLKGTGDLYSCKEMIENYCQTLLAQGILNSKEQLNDLITNHIIFTEKTLTCTRINHLYNACDIYLSPYMAEGFNLTVLEAIAAGMKVIVSDNGSTKDFIDNIIMSVPETKNSLIYVLPTQVLTLQDKKQILQVNIDSLINLTISAINSNTIELGFYENLQKFLENNYSWTEVCRQLLEYFYELKT